MGSKWGDKWELSGKQWGREGGKWEKGENLVMVNFDEMYTKNKCGLDTKLQMVMGPSKNVQCL